MENQKLLWIVFSITLFLLVVVVVGFIWFLPSDEQSPAEAIAGAGVVTETTARMHDPIEWIRETESVPGMTDAEGPGANDDVVIVIGESESDPESTTGTIGIAEAATQGDEVSTIRVAEPTPRATTSAPASVAQSRAPASVPAAPRTVRVTQYWIQAGSFQNRMRAEETQEALADKGFTTRVTSRDVSGQTYFRVRLGPFEAKAEAEKFLNWIKEIDSFGGSYISEVYANRTAN